MSEVYDCKDEATYLSKITLTLLKPCDSSMMFSGGSNIIEESHGFSKVRVIFDKYVASSLQSCTRTVKRYSGFIPFLLFTSSNVSVRNAFQCLGGSLIAYVYNDVL